MSLFDFFKPSKDYVSFDDQIQWLRHKPPKNSYKNINYLTEWGGGTHYSNDIYFDQYLMKSASRYYGLSTLLGNNCYYIEIYLIDDKFTYDDKFFRTYNDDFCYPMIYRGGYSEGLNFVKDGPWIDKLKQKMNEYGVKQSYLKYKTEYEQRLQKQKDKRDQEQQCCKLKRASVLENFK